MSVPDRLVVLDSSGETLERCSALGEWLCWSDVGHPNSEAIVAAGADAVGKLYASLRRAHGRAADLWTPDGRTELERVLLIEEDIRDDVEVVVTAAVALPLDLRSREPRSFAVYLARCLAASASEPGRAVSAVPHAGQDRIRLTEVQWLAYRRFAAMVLTDPLERFAATGLTGPLPDESPRSRRDAPGMDI